jgi:hypothetical protein
MRNFQMTRRCRHSWNQQTVGSIALLMVMILLLNLSCNALGAEVWTGGSRAWGDFTAPGNEDKWAFVRDNVDGLYINNFAMRPGESKTPTREDRLAGMYKLLKNKRVFYETDRIHSNDDFDRESIDLFLKLGFDYTGTTINYGTNESRNKIITRDGRVPLYYMFGPWNGEGDINNDKNNDLRSQIRKYAGAAVDDPVTMWRGANGHTGTRSMVYSTIKWCHGNKQKFLFLLAPNESGKTFLPEAQQLVRDLEDHKANPDIWAVAFYGPQSFRDKLEVLPETDADGHPAATFSGVPYWLIHHLRDPKGYARLSSPQSLAISGNPGKTQDISIDLTNSSNWLDLTPVLRLRTGAAQGFHVTGTLDGIDVTTELQGDGLVFNCDRHLDHGTSRRLVLHLTIESAGAATGICRLELLPNPAELNRVNQTLDLKINAGASG